MTKARLTWAALLVAAIGWAGCALAQDMSVKQSAPPGSGQSGTIVTPESSIPKPGDTGERAHTNVEIFVPTPVAPPKIHPGQDGPNGKPPESSPPGAAAPR
jgi:hypothetical protein